MSQPDPADVEKRLSALANEALELRFGAADDPLGPVALPNDLSNPQVVMDSLVRVRQRLDRVDYLLCQVMALRTAAKRGSDSAQAQADDAWDTAVMSIRNATVRRNDDFTGPRERYAEANLATINQKRDARLANDTAYLADSYEQVVRHAQRGLDSLRYDHIAVLNGLNVLHYLER